MANDDGNIKSKKKESSTASLSRSIDTSGLRRSTRETPISQSNAHRSERIETQTTPTPSPVKKKPDRIEEQMGPSSLRRSDRSKTQLSTDASGSKKLVELPVSLSPIIKSKKEKTASSPKEDAGDVSAENKSDSKNEGRDPDIGGRKRKRMTVHGYKSLFNPQRLRIEAEDGQHSHESDRITESGNVEKQIGGKCSQDNDGNMMTQNMAIDACEDNDKQISPKSPSSQCKKHGEGEQVMAIDACEDNDKQISPKSPSSECKKHGDDEQRTTESGNGDKQIGGKCSQDNNGNMMTQSMDIDACEDNDKQISPKSPSLEGKKHGNDEQSINDDLTNHQDLDSHNNSCDKNLPEAPATKVRKTSCEEAAVMVMENTETSHNNNNDNNNNNYSKFVEFWVPIEISNVQLEQYCSSLLSNAVALCSLSKISDSLGALHDLFISNRKCCNHPYIVNTALLDSVKKDQPEWSWDLHYRVSGKLHFLDLILPKVKKRQQRVVILLQPQGGSSSKCTTIGNILDEFIVQRFGEDSLSRVDGTGSNRSIQKSVSNTFNTDMNKFIFMLDSTTCHPTIKLSSVDIIIIFDSDLNPANDIKSLHKISIDSNPNQVMVFRLYSKNTLEEKILKLAQDNVIVDTKLQDLKKSTSDALLMWGAKDLFQKLSLFHGISGKDITSEESFFKNVMNEFLYIISNKCNDTGRESVITKVDICGSYGDKTKPYSEIKTHLLDGEEQPHVFWRNLLDGRYPLWKFVPVSTSRQRKRPIYYGDKPDKTTPVAVADVVKKRKKSLALKAVVEKETEDVSGGHNESEPSSGDQYWIATVNSEKSLSDILKPTVYKLCNIFDFPVDIKNTVESFLDYVIANYQVSEDHEPTLQAFMISLCWIGASLSKDNKFDKSKSFDLAKMHLNFDCEEEEANKCYRKLEEAKEMFLKQKQDQENHDDFKETESTEQKTSLESQHNEHVDVSENQELVNEERFGIIEKQSEEIERFNKEWDEKRANLENDYKLEIALIRTIHTNQSVRSEKLQSLDKELAIKLEEHEKNKEIQLKNLKSTILTAKMTEMPSELDGCRDQDQSKEKGSLGIGDDIESTGSQTSEKQIVDAIPFVEAPPRQHDGTVDDDVAVVVNGEVPAQQSDGVVGDDVAGDVECVDVEILEVESNKENGKGESSGAADVAVHVPGGDEEKEDGKSQDVEEQNDSCGSSNSNQPPAGVPHDDTPSAPVQQFVSQDTDHPMPTILETESDSLLEELLELGIQEKEGQAADPISFPEINPEEPHPANEVSPCENDANAPELLNCIQNSVPPEIPNQTTSQPPENEINTQHPANEVLVLPCENDASAPEPPEINMFDVQVASRVPNHGDPLQAELERLCVVKNSVTKSHEDMKQKLKVDCEKEIAEMIAKIKLKYEGKCKEAETAFHKRKREIDTTLNKIVMNKMLAEAFRAKCKDLTPSGPDSSPARLMQTFHRVSFRPSHAVTSSSPSQSSRVQQTPPPPPPPPPPPVPPPLQIVDQPAALFSTPLIRPPPSTINPVTPATRPPPTITPTTRPPPTITPVTPTTRPPPTITPLAGSLRGPAPHLRPLVNGDVRAPAPHMRAFKPSTSASPDFTYQSRRVPPGQHVTSTLNAQPLVSTTSIQVQPPPPPPPPPQSTPPPPPQVAESGGGEWELLDPTGVILVDDDARRSSGQDLVYLSDDD